MQIRQSIMPLEVQYARKPELPRTFDLEAIACFAATGFFFEKDTYWRDQIALQPAYDYELDANGRVKSEHSWWQWHYSPRDISLKQAVEEFAHLFERIVQEAVRGKQVILPLSGGLDSRTLAAALRGHSEGVTAFSYQFPGGIRETNFARAVAHAAGFDFHALEIPVGYLWKEIPRLSHINQCYSDFTAPRQMAFFDQYPAMGDVFLLGHWGDVLFDDMGVSGELPLDTQVDVVIKKIVKKGGLELAESLWKQWGLKGKFSTYLKSRIEHLLLGIPIENANARIRAFKSLYWAYRWTTVNVGVFAAARPVILPYYHEDMCRFICTVPERWLATRMIQIEYLKMVAPNLARISWQAHRPLNLYNYRWDRTPWNLPYRVIDKGKRVFQEMVMRHPFIQRNWEIQFLGTKNEQLLQRILFENGALKELISDSLVKKFYEGFRHDKLYYSHPVNMLLVFSIFTKLYRNL